MPPLSLWCWGDVFGILQDESCHFECFVTTIKGGDNLKKHLMRSKPPGKIFGTRDPRMQATSDQTCSSARFLWFRFHTVSSLEAPKTMRVTRNERGCVGCPFKVLRKSVSIGGMICPVSLGL